MINSAIKLFEMLNSKETEMSSILPVNDKTVRQLVVQIQSSRAILMK